MTDDTHSGPSALDRLPFDPAWIAIGVAGAIIVGAGFSMMSSGEAPQAGPVAAPPAVTAAAPPPAPVAVAPAMAPAAPVAPPAAPAPAPAPAPAAREAMLEARLAEREAELRAIAQRVAALEQSVPRIAAAEARTERLVALDALRAQMERGQPLGEALRRLPGTAPAALARYATAAPPTESALRLSFEEAVRAARA
ncbi:MAG: hypothetical protein MUF65_08905, partial [Rubritepida sp.]|nr:hypothetical protein [Rubritepida sp.]